MNPYFAVLDQSKEVIALAVGFSGRERVVPGIFLKEEDALEVAIATELATGRPHLVVSIRNAFMRMQLVAAPSLA